MAVRCRARLSAPVHYLHLLDMFIDLGFGPEAIDRMIVDYRRIYPCPKHALTTVFPGVPEMLAALDGRKTTATIKGTPMTRRFWVNSDCCPISTMCKARTDSPRSRSRM